MLAALGVLAAAASSAAAGADELAHQQRIKPAFDRTQGNSTGRTAASASCPNSHPHVVGGASS